MLVIHRNHAAWCFAHPPPQGCLIPQDLLCPVCLEYIQNKWTICDSCMGYIHFRTCAVRCEDVMIDGKRCVACSRTD